MRLALLVLPVILLSGPVAARAAEPKYSPAYERCLAAPAGQSTAGMIGCIGVELKAQDARLNRAYQDAMKRMDLPRQKAALTKAQRAWIAFRDADCASLYDPDWGTLSRVEANSCVLDRTAQRADALERFGQAR